MESDYAKRSLKKSDIAGLVKLNRKLIGPRRALKFFLKYVDDIVRTMRVDPTVVFEAANILHSNLHFTVEEFGITGNF